MRPEIYARFDLHCVFNKLDYLTLNRIGQLHVDKCLDLIRAQGHAMRVLGSIVAAEMVKSGGHAVSGVVQYERRSNKCFLEY